MIYRFEPELRHSFFVAGSQPSGRTPDCTAHTTRNEEVRAARRYGVVPLEQLNILRLSDWHEEVHENTTSDLHRLDFLGSKNFARRTIEKGGNHFFFCTLSADRDPTTLWTGQKRWKHGWQT